MMLATSLTSATVTLAKAVTPTTAMMPAKAVTPETAGTPAAANDRV